MTSNGRKVARSYRFSRSSKPGAVTGMTTQKQSKPRPAARWPEKALQRANAVFGPDIRLPASTARRVYPTQMRNPLRERGDIPKPRTVPSKQCAFAAAGQYRDYSLALAGEYPSSDEGHTAIIRTIRDAMLSRPGGTSGQIVFAVAVLLVVVGIVFLIACSNVANHLPARPAARRHEIIIRLATSVDPLTALREA